MDLISDLGRHLAADPGVMALVDRYAGIAAVFNDDTMPSDHKLNRFVILSSIAAQNDESSTEKGFHLVADARVFVRRRDDAQTAAVEDLAFAVRGAINRKGFPIIGGRLVSAAAGMPVRTPTSGPEIFGRRVPITIHAEEA